MSGVASRGRYALYLIARPFHRLRNQSQREVIALAEVPPPPEAPYQADEPADLSSSESVPVEETQTTVPAQPPITRGTLRMEGATSVINNIREAFWHSLARLQLLLPWAEEEEAEAVPGDDPTFQQLLMLSGLFCGPVMFFIGGLLFCVMPREHTRTRKWSCWNGLLALASLFYIVSTTTMDDLPKQRSPGIHLQDAQDHQRIPQLETGTLELLPKSIKVSSMEWRAADQDVDRSLLASTLSYTDQYIPFNATDMPGVPSLGPAASWYDTKEEIILGTPSSLTMSGLVNVRYSLASNERLERSNVSRFFVDCSGDLSSRECAGGDGATSPGVVSGGLRCGVDGTNTGTFVPVWQLRAGDLTAEAIAPRVEDGVVKFGTKRPVVCTPEVRVGAPLAEQATPVYLVSIRVWI